MFKNYLKIAFRNLWRNKTFSAINILGLAIGLATCLVITLFVVHELSHDRYHEKADRLVRVVFRASIQGDKIKEAVVMPPVPAFYAKPQSIAELVDWSGGLYEPPAKFRSW